MHPHPTLQSPSGPDRQPLYAVNELFQTLQGEGFHCGTPMTLLRLQGCPVQCAWCDTKQSWFQLPENERSLQECLEKERSAPTWAKASAKELLTAAQRFNFPIKKLLITGGEPACADLRPLCDCFEAEAWQIFLETSGTEEIRGSAQMWVTVSPKFNMRGGSKVRDDALLRANEIKFVVARPADLQLLEACLARVALPKSTLISLQPVAQNPNIIPFCIEAVMRRNWRLSLQTHKFLNLR